MNTSGPGTSGEPEEIVQPIVEETSNQLVRLNRDLANIVTPIELSLGPKVRILSNSLRPVVLERYRRLRTKLIQEGVGTSIKSVMVTSAGAEEGKTLTALNMALSFALLSPMKVAVVDGDLRRASIGEWLGAPFCMGLANLIDGSAKLNEVVKKSERLPVYFVFAGDSMAAPAELLEPAPLRLFINQLTQYFDLVIIDSPPISLIADAQLLGQACDGVVLVARAYSTKRKALERAIHDLAGQKILGTVFNAGSDTRDYGNYY